MSAKKRMTQQDKKRRDVARKIAREIFTSGAGERATRLVIETPRRQFGGESGYCETAVADIIERRLRRFTLRSPQLCFPAQILDQHLVVLGKTGAGKSSALRHIVEYLLGHKKRVCIIDPKGDWWGLKASSDVPINAQSGRHVADRGWMTSHMVQFWIDFASGIFNANSGELYLVGDEFHNFAPKGKIMDPQAGKCLHWSNRLLSEGRGLGIVCLIASQRPQKVHNDTLTSCETLVAMRVVHAADRAAVEDWIKGCGESEAGRAVLSEVASMQRGEAFVWSPEIGFGPKRLKFPMFETFDSFAPPQLQKKVSQRGWADVDLGAVKEKLAAVIKEQQENDPKELRKKIVDLKRELAKKTPIEQLRDSLKEKRVEVPVLKDSQITRLEKFVDRFERSLIGFSQVAKPIVEGIAKQIVSARQSLALPARTAASVQKAPVMRVPPPIRDSVRHDAKRFSNEQKKPTTERLHEK